MSFISKLYIGVAVLMLGGFGWVGFTGWEHSTPGQRIVPAAVRAAPSGYRTFHFWHVGFGGYRGGK